MTDSLTAKFDPNANYKALKNFRFAGRAVVAGGHIDPSQLGDAERDRKMGLLIDHQHIGVMTDDEAKEAGLKTGTEPLNETQAARVKELVEGNSRDDLNDLADAAGIDDADKLPNKEAVAEAIVRAEAAEAA